MKLRNRFVSRFQACWTKAAKRLVTASGRCFFARRVQRAGDQQRPRIVVHAIAVRPVRHAVDGVLEQPDIVAHGEEVLRRRSCGGNFPRCGAPWSCSSRPWAAVAPGVVEGRDIAFRRPGPGHRPAAGIGPLAHGVAPGIVSEQPSNLPPDGRRVAERHQDAAAIRQKLGACQ